MDATAEALAPEQAPDLDADLSAIFDKNETADEQVDEAPVEEPKQEEQPVEAEAAAEAEEQPEKSVEAPSDLPKAIRDSWADIPESARSAFVEAQRDMARKLGDNGRLMQGLKPIQEVLVDAVKSMPALADMSPADAAKRIADASRSFNAVMTNPDGAAEDIVEKFPEFARAVAAKVSGQPANQNVLAQANQRIEHLERQLQQFANPEYLRSQFSQLNTETMLQSQVEEFAAKAEHWADVESTMPHAIAYIREAQPDASPSDVLKLAYDLEVRRLGKATPEPAAAEAAQTVDPVKTEKALKAKSVNVKSQTSGKDRVKSEDELLESVYRKMNS